jgi:hypothetical protein
MRYWARATLTAVCLAATTSALAAKPSPHSPVSTRQNPVTTARGPLQIQVPLQAQAGKSSGPAQQFKPLQIQVTPRKPEGSASPTPVATPEYNPLKRRRMAMPGIPEPDLAF